MPLPAVGVGGAEKERGGRLYLMTIDTMFCSYNISHFILTT